MIEQQRTGTMEAVGQILPRLIDHSRRQSRTNFDCSKSVNVPATGTTQKPTHGKPSASIADLRHMLQALGVMELLPDEEVLFHASRIETAYQGRIACKTCRKQKESTLTCSRTGVKCQDGKLFFFFESCPNATPVRLAALREKLRALGIHEEVDDDVLEEHSTDIESAMKAAKRCASCDKQDASVLSCACEKLGFEDGELHLRFGNCPRSQQVKARLEQERLAKEQMNQLIISKRFRSRRFQNFRMFGKAADTCRLVKKWTDEWTEELGTGLLLHGQAGNGKTHLAVAAMMDVHERFGVPAVFDVLPAFLAKLRQGYRKTAQEREKDALVGDRDLFDLYAKVPLLVLDDIDKVSRSAGGQPSSWTREVVFLLVNHRYENMLPTIFTMNAAPEAIKTLFGEAVYSRIAEMCYFIRDEGADYRMAFRSPKF